MFACPPVQSTTGCPWAHFNHSGYLDPDPFCVSPVQSTAALPFGTIVIILVIWALVTIPLTIFGGIAGKNYRQEFLAPTRTNKYPREVPELPWYRSTVPQMVMAGAYQGF